jgi:hypothetical protein
MDQREPEAPETLPPFVHPGEGLGQYVIRGGVRHRVRIPRRCRKCGCTQERACPGGCSWVAWDLCSRCAGKGER